MSQQRMAGDNEFQSKMKQAASGPGGQEHKTKPASLMGAGAWDRQVDRESSQFNNAAVSGSRGAKNIAAYAKVSKSATKANGDFSINAGNKWVDNSRNQGNTNKEQNKGFSDNRVNNNVQFANQQQDNNLRKNADFTINTTNDLVNNAKKHREDNTTKATEFADRTVNKYIQKNKGYQAINVGAMDKQVRSAPIVDNAYSTVQGNNTYGDMYSYGRKELPDFKMPAPMKGVETPDFKGMYEQTREDLDKYKV